MAQEQTGLYKKYIVTKADGTPVDPKAIYFVMRLDTDPAAREAVEIYTRWVDDYQLAADLSQLLHDLAQGNLEGHPVPLAEKAQHAFSNYRVIYDEHTGQYITTIRGDKFILPDMEAEKEEDAKD